MIDARKVRATGKLLFKMETRSRSGSKRKMIFLMISYLLPGLFLPFLLYKQNTDPTGFEFTFLTYLFYGLIVAFTISSELDNLLVTRNEAEIFAAMPLEDGLLVRAKLYMLSSLSSGCYNSAFPARRYLLLPYDEIGTPLNNVFCRGLYDVLFYN